MSTTTTAGGHRPLLELRQLEKRYGNGTLALQGMDLAIGEHEFVSFLGPSGCGKSTALKMIAGLSPITGGTIAWGGPGQADHSHDISFVFQEPTLMPWATVFNNVWLPLRLKGRSRAEARAEVEAALQTVGLAQFAEVYPRELSGGMKMRVSIARAMVTQPRLLLMDEPFAALDEMTRFKLNNDTLALWQANRFTTIFVTHSVYESVYLSNRIIVMAARPGRVIADIRIDEPYPRSDAFRTTARYNELCVQVSQALHSAGGDH
ncbi:ABC transporter ATP-binding protein [Variovorax terrae]|uniref:ABC transporter ATP-binding protein n=1 Tax=Variovorax terrae TaxID=2923278 RepID=A0A9X2AKY7_9BURK|nr:ABC transporter ATP-binding protein [Variovorax terrae]MCJ0761659.1 ABC transporter ATP-binding protein [Variovorax terrae]